jgi:D-amino-acid dehydrogenase
MGGQDEIAVIGAGVVGAAVACALAREGHRVVLYDRDEPGRGGASFGNVGHIATELVEPLPSVKLLLTFWKELSVFGGPLVMPVHRWPQLLPWSLRFAAAAFRREANTRHLAPLVRSGADALQRWLAELGRPELFRRNGHYEVFFGAAAAAKCEATARAMAAIEVPAQPAPGEVVERIRTAAKQALAAGLWYPDGGHVLDPLEIVRAFVDGAIGHGARFERVAVQALRPRGDSMEIVAGGTSRTATSAVVCAGVWSAPLLESFGLRAPLEAASGYHVEMPGEAPLVDAPVIYADPHIVVTPMRGRLRASTWMEFSGIDATPTPSRPTRLREKLPSLGYRCAPQGDSWMGPRPVLPDYLPGIGRAPGTGLFYAIGHQHVGLTMAAGTGELLADLVAGRKPRLDVSAFDLRRF